MTFTLAQHHFVVYVCLLKPSVTMPRGRSAISARSDISEMDTDGTGNVVVIDYSMLMLSIFCC